MLYCEFVENTGCKDNEHNYKLYKRLELIYMNDDTISKSEIYEMGKKLADNSKSKEELEFEQELLAQIDDHKKNIKAYQSEIAYNKEMKDLYTGYNTPTDKHMRRCYSDAIKVRKEWIATEKRHIRELNWILGKGEL